MSPSTSTQATSSVPTFESLGLRPVVNCMGTYTFLSGSRLIRQAADAMVEATNHYVEMDQLMEAVGKRLAELTGAEWGYITSGCAAALTQIAAAAIAGADPEKMVRLPDTTGLKNEIIMQKAHRNSYDFAMRMTGAHMVDVVTMADLRAALSDRTALIAITGRDDERNPIPIPEMIAFAREHGVPTLVDAAAERPDSPNRYLQMGADAVLYSGGKCLRGPQASGLALGRKDLLQAAFLNGAPHHAFGRPMKAGKEEIMGLLAAVEAWFLGRDHDAEWRMWEGWLAHIQEAVADLPSVETSVHQPGLSNHAPSLKIAWDPAVLHVTPEQAHQELFYGDPPVVMHQRGEELWVMPYMMENGDAEIAAECLRAVLSKRIAATPSSKASPTPADVSGDWEIATEYLLGKSDHAMSLQQDGTALEGTYRSQFQWATVAGEVDGAKVAFQVRLGTEANWLTYKYEGEVSGDTMEGTVDLGEFWQASWTAQRVVGG